MTGKPQVLCLGHDPILNRTRRLILQRYFEVTLADRLQEAVSQLSIEHFDLVLLCYSLTDDECRAVIDFIHKLPEPPRILALAQARQRLRLAPQDEEFLLAGPEQLLSKATSMAGIPIEEPAKEDPKQPARKNPFENE